MFSEHQAMGWRVDTSQRATQRHHCCSFLNPAPARAFTSNAYPSQDYKDGACPPASHIILKINISRFLRKTQIKMPAKQKKLLNEKRGKAFMQP